MRIEPTHIPDVLLLKRERFVDSRGWSTELHNEASLHAVRFDVRFVQDNLSRSEPGVLRGLHFQRDPEQGKLVTCLAGRIYDVAVDLRPGSSTFGQHVSVELNADEGDSLWVPAGFAHGFLVLGSEPAWLRTRWINTAPPPASGALSGTTPPLRSRGRSRPRTSLV